jgi:hypothetical protein
VHAHSADFQQQQQQLRQRAAALQEVVAPWKLSAWLIKTADARARPQRLVRRARAVNLSSESGDAATDSDSSGSSDSGGGSSVEWVSAVSRFAVSVSSTSNCVT